MREGLPREGRPANEFLIRNLACRSVPLAFCWNCPLLARALSESRQRASNEHDLLKSSHLRILKLSVPRKPAPLSPPGSRPSRLSFSPRNTSVMLPFGTGNRGKEGEEGNRRVHVSLSLRPKATTIVPRPKTGASSSSSASTTPLLARVAAPELLPPLLAVNVLLLAPPALGLASLALVPSSPALHLGPPLSVRVLVLFLARLVVVVVGTSRSGVVLSLLLALDAPANVDVDARGRREAERARDFGEVERGHVKDRLERVRRVRLDVRSEPVLGRLVQVVVLGNELLELFDSCGGDPFPGASVIRFQN